MHHLAQRYRQDAHLTVRQRNHVLGQQSQLFHVRLHIVLALRQKLKPTTILYDIITRADPTPTPPSHNQWIRQASEPNSSHRAANCSFHFSPFGHRDFFTARSWTADLSKKKSKAKGFKLKLWTKDAGSRLGLCLPIKPYSNSSSGRKRIELKTGLKLNAKLNLPPKQNKNMGRDSCNSLLWCRAHSIGSGSVQGQSWQSSASHWKRPWSPVSASPGSGYRWGVRRWIASEFASCPAHFPTERPANLGDYPRTW